MRERGGLNSNPSFYRRGTVLINEHGHWVSDLYLFYTDIRVDG